MEMAQNPLPSATTAAPPHESVKETFESIVVALILAFVFRAFIIEAFVIPTGSMAPTLYGAHGTIVCEDCGWEFAYGLLDAPHSQGGGVTPNSRALCPNCSHFNTKLEINDKDRNAETGDRILVLKWPYDLGGSFLGPARWDVAVFKNPSDGAQNYIKRLTGVPNEVLMIVDGDVYSVPTSQLSEAAVKELNDLRHVKYQYQVRPRRDPFPQPSTALTAELVEKMTIPRKTEVAQKSLWFIVYDHDHMPRKREPDQPLWEPDRVADIRWDCDTRVLRFDGLDADTQFIELRHKLLLAGYSYNLSGGGQGIPPVSDQRIRFVLTPQSAEGTLRIRLVKGNRTFWASLHMDGRVTLAESPDLPTAGTPLMAERNLAPFAPGRSVEVAFENVDYRLALHVAGKEVLASSPDRASRAFYGPNLQSLLKMRRVPEAPPPRICAQQAKLELAHVVVERDIYYYQTTNLIGFGDVGGWGTAGNPILLRDKEYFMLGDNSPASQDSRLWTDITKNHYLTARGEDYQFGTVPMDQLIGKAFFVYWPSAQRPKWLPLPRGWGIVPDVGRMRWIR